MNSTASWAELPNLVDKSLTKRQLLLCHTQLNLAIMMHSCLG